MTLLQSNYLTKGFIVQMHQVELKGEACLKACPIIFEREDDNSTQMSPPRTPPSQHTSDAPRKSSRVGSGGKRSYQGMQSRQDRGGRPRKKFKYSLPEIPGMSSMTPSLLDVAWPLDKSV